MNNIEDKIIEVLEKNNIKPDLSGDYSLGTIRFYEKEKLEKVVNELESLFKEYKSYYINSSHVSSCCVPSYEEIRYKIEL